MAVTPTNRKLGIKKVDLVDQHPSFLSDCENKLVSWHEAGTNIRNRIQTYLVFIAKIKFKQFDCFTCIYPTKYSADYTVFVDIDCGKSCFLVSTLRDNYIPTKSGRRIEMLKDDLLLLDAPQHLMLNLRQGMPYQPHPDEQFHH